jgi:CHAT domain-containing protein
LPPEFDSLELADFETQMVLAHLPGVELKGNDAQIEDVINELPKAALAHFCCHGTVDYRFFYSGILLLAYPEILMFRHLRDIAEVPARLVALSACRSGSAALKVDSVLSLPALFLAAGAAAVLGTLWHSDEMATLLLMTRFYSLLCGEGLGEGVDPATALRQAQVWLMSSTAATLRAVVSAEALDSPASATLKSAADEDVPYSHPWYWSAFFLAGA